MHAQRSPDEGSGRRSDGATPDVDTRWGATTAKQGVIRRSFLRRDGTAFRQRLGNGATDQSGLGHTQHSSADWQDIQGGIRSSTPHDSRIGTAHYPRPATSRGIDQGYADDPIVQNARGCVVGSGSLELRKLVAAGVRSRRGTNRSDDVVLDVSSPVER